MYEIKSFDVTSNNIKKILENNKEFNDYINENVENSNDWVIYASSNYFRDNRIENYKNIPIKYNDFILTYDIIILNKVRR